MCVLVWLVWCLFNIIYSFPLLPRYFYTTYKFFYGLWHWFAMTYVVLSHRCLFTLGCWLVTEPVLMFAFVTSCFVTVYFVFTFSNLYLLVLILVSFPLSFFPYFSTSSLPKWIHCWSARSRAISFACSSCEYPSGNSSFSSW